MNLYSYSKTPSEYSPRTVGQPYTLDYRCYIEKNGQPVSPFHDIPLYANEQQTILNMVVEIPRWSNAKQEVCKTGLEVGVQLLTQDRSPRRISSTRSSRISRRANSGLSETASHTRATSGTTVPSQE